MKANLGEERTIADHRTGETLTFVKTAAESGGDRVEMCLELAPGTVVPVHAHPTEETFELLQGAVEFEVDRKRVDVRRGPVTVAPGRLHGFRNLSGEPVVLSILGRPGAEAEFGLRLKFLLSRDGYLPAPGGGRPKRPLLGMVVVNRSRLYFPPLPRFLFRLITGALAALGRARGEERFLLENYPEYRRLIELRRSH